MKRKDALVLIRVAGYHEDTAAGIRLYVENRVSFEAYTVVFQRGRAMKAAGVKCSCIDCNRRAA
jgi:hypothetical protein